MGGTLRKLLVIGLSAALMAVQAAPAFAAFRVECTGADFKRFHWTIPPHYDHYQFQRSDSSQIMNAYIETYRILEHNRTLTFTCP